MSGRGSAALALTALLSLLATGGSATAARIDHRLEAALAAAGGRATVEVIVSLEDPAPRSALPPGGSGGRRPARARELREAHEPALARVRPVLENEGATIVAPLWIVNAVVVRAPAGAVRRIARAPGVTRVRLDEAVHPPVSVPAAPAGPAWNLDALRVRELWGLGLTGAGVTVALLDTGVDPLHADLAGRWRGGAGGWFDPYGEHDAPRDLAAGTEAGHGTAVAGIAVGGDAGGTPIGVAPGAQWIAAKIFDDSGVGTLSGIHLAFQWALDPDGDPGTDDAPRVVNASFGFPERAGECYREFEPDIEVLRSAGIAVVFSAGNAGPAPLSSVSPGNNAGAYPVGAVGPELGVAAFSSRGPSACGGGLFPALVAPGRSVTSADLTAGGLFPASYAARTGTSFAAPHLAGLFALLAEARPEATVPQIEAALAAGAFDLGAEGPDNDSGAGLPDAVRAWRVLGGLPPCPDDDGDGFFPWEGCGTAVDCEDSDGSVHPGAAEIPFDGVDQDCNGFDLTIRVRRALYRRSQDRLVVVARSDLRRRARLRVEGLGRMRWIPTTRRWRIEVHGLRRDPRTVLVRGREGAVSVPTVRRP